MQRRKKVVTCPTQLTTANVTTNPTTPPLLSEEDEIRIRKLILPLPSHPGDPDGDGGDGSLSKSTTPSPRPSVCGLERDRPMEEEDETILKILVIGDSTVGKTSYVQGFVQNKFFENCKNTVGVDFSTKLLSHKKYGGKPVKLQIWDIAGQDRYICLTRVYYQNSDGCIIMFDLTNRKTFESVKQWKHDLDSKCILDNGTMLPCLLLASKCDLPHRQVEMNEIETLCSQLHFMSWIEVSSKEHLMIEDSMNFLVDRIICTKRMQRKPSLILSSEQAGKLNDDRPRKLSVPVDPRRQKPATYCWC